MSKLGDDYVPPENILLDSMPFTCKWIISLLNKAIVKTISSFEAYDFAGAASAVYSWWQFELCDVFIEVIKPYFNNSDKAFESERESSKDALWICLDNGLRLLHPFMPFVSEELWQRLPQKSMGSDGERSIMTSGYPSVVEVMNL